MSILTHPSLAGPSPYSERPIFLPTTPFSTLQLGLAHLLAATSFTSPWCPYSAAPALHLSGLGASPGIPSLLSLKAPFEPLWPLPRSSIGSSHSNLKPQLTRLSLHACGSSMSVKWG